MKLEIAVAHEMKRQKKKKLNNTLWNVEWVPEEIKKEIKKSLKLTENETVIMNPFEYYEGSPMREVHNGKCLHCRIEAISHK